MSHPSIRSAREIGNVWKSFYTFINNNLSDNKEGCVVAYHGAASDMKWIWRLTQCPDAIHEMPKKLKWFLDPLKIIKKFTGCKINPNKSKLESLRLGAVWSFINDGETLAGAHDSLFYARAQVDVLVHPHFVPYLDRSKSFVTINDVFGTNELRELLKQSDPTQPVHKLWFELNADSNFEWLPPRSNRYKGPAGGGIFGPKMGMKLAARTAVDLAAIFFKILSLLLWETIATLSNKFCYKDWVVEKFGKDRDGNRKKVRYFEDVRPNLVQSTRNKRHRGDKDKKKFKIKTGFGICFIARIVLQGAQFGSNNPSTARLYRKGR